MACVVKKLLYLVITDKLSINVAKDGFSVLN